MARVLRRGDVVWAHLGQARGSEQKGHWPVLVLSRTSFNRRSGTVVTAALTSRKPGAGYPLTVELESSGLPRRSWVRNHQIRTLSVDRLGKKITSVSPEELASVVRGLFEIIGR
jgi:mRNA interferase MazF